jgi:hypothetical protein
MQTMSTLQTKRSTTWFTTVVGTLLLGANAANTSPTSLVKVKMLSMESQLVQQQPFMAV